MQFKINALNEASARPDAGRRTTVVPASQLMAAWLYQEGHPPAELDAGRGHADRGDRANRAPSGHRTASL